MNKKILTIVSTIPITLALLVAPVAYGKTATISARTNTPTPTSSSMDAKIEDLKVRLATKVAELRKSSPKAISGTVTNVSISSITVDTTTKSMKIDLTDSIKVFQILKGKRTTLSTDDISKNDPVTIFGDYDTTLDVLKANIVFIEATNQPQRIHGFVSEIDKKNNSLTVTGLDDTVYTVDIETTTKTFSYTDADSIAKSGFSKIETGMFVSVLGTPDPKKTNTFSANRILHMNAKPGAAPTLTPTKTPTETATPSATGIVKPTVTKKPTATPTP
jgi:hypothetical protein